MARGNGITARCHIRRAWDRHLFPAPHDGDSQNLDSLIDATIRVPFSVVRSVARLGDIDGSGMESIALGYDQIPHSTPNPFPGAILFIKPGQGVPSSGAPRTLPHIAGESCGGLASVMLPRGASECAHLRIEPNPSRDGIRVRWDAAEIGGEATVVITDVMGSERLRERCRLNRGELILPTGALGPGAYFATVTTARRAALVGFTVAAH